jgi:hypothetical protein
MVMQLQLFLVRQWLHLLKPHVLLLAISAVRVIAEKSLVSLICRRLLFLILLIGFVGWILLNIDVFHGKAYKGCSYNKFGLYHLYHS